MPRKVIKKPWFRSCRVRLDNSHSYKVNPLVSFVGLEESL